jgi:DNA adenine methylase
MSIGKIKSPLRYPGGKSKAAEYISGFIPNFKEFREPFFGGGSLSFYLIQRNPDAEYYANDINEDLYHFWSELKNSKDEIIEQIINIKNTYKNGKELYRDIINRKNENAPFKQRAVDFFILNRITFSGTADSGGYSEQSFLKRFTNSSIERLNQSYEIIKKINFSNEDYSRLITKPGKEIFIYLDPPYYSNTDSKLYGKNGNLHKKFDHIKFFETVKNCQHKFLITYDNNDFIKTLWKDFNIIEWQLQYGMNNYQKSACKKGSELIITNFTPKEGENK